MHIGGRIWAVAIVIKGRYGSCVGGR